MAEILGVVASGVSIAAFAGQIVSSIMKLKSYIDQVKDAPEHIRILVDEIDDLQLLLSELSDDQSRYPHQEMLAGNKSVMRSLESCQRGVDRLRWVVDEIASDFGMLKPMRRKLISVKVVWKKGKIEKYRADLAATVRLLTFAYQIYTKYEEFYFKDNCFRKV